MYFRHYKVVYTPDSLGSCSSVSSSLGDLGERGVGGFYRSKTKTVEKTWQKLITPWVGKDRVGDREADEEIAAINRERAEGAAEGTSLILEKILRINQLQERINDINRKIESIDMTGGGDVVSGGCLWFSAFGRVKGIRFCLVMLCLCT